MGIITKPPYENGTPEIIQHESWGEHIAWVEDASRVTMREGRSSRKKDEESWNGSKSWEDALVLAKGGWKAGEKRVAAIARRLEVQILHRIVKEDFNYDVEGMSFDVARYLNGEPEHWTRMEESLVTSAAGSKHVKIVSAIAASSGVDAQAIIARGAAIAALVELLEYADHRVELWTCNALSGGYTRDKGPVFVNLVRVKPFDQPIDMSRISFALAHPSMFRRLGFAVQETAHPSYVNDVTRNGSYGMPTNYQPEDTSLYMPTARMWDETVNWTSPESAETWILAQLAKQGVVLSDV